MSQKGFGDPMDIPGLGEALTAPDEVAAFIKWLRTDDRTSDFFNDVDSDDEFQGAMLCTLKANVAARHKHSDGTETVTVVVFWTELDEAYVMHIKK